MGLHWPIQGLLHSLNRPFAAVVRAVRSTPAASKAAIPAIPHGFRTKQ